MSREEGIPLCVDCKHHTVQKSEVSIATYHACEKFKTIDPVTGLRSYNDCYSLRGPGGVCGPRGEGWQNKLR